ncbi:hypothetical protein M9H77_12038 [Catharanthus roseus]|uniref:Uncharacterized protein n=1 Tax=Catharanthus roseus TaxID=4058 RepID=A0ACC0BG80_CATRO|nr:hypothetical protein M9H77_12038 [Catharanthus roseus]
MQGRNTMEEVLCLSVEWGYTVFYRNKEDSNVLNDIVIAHPTSIAMIRTWPYVLIMDTTYNMPLLKAVGMTLTGKNFTVVTAFMRNEQGRTYRWVYEDEQKDMWCNGRGGRDLIGICGSWVEDSGVPVS